MKRIVQVVGAAIVRDRRVLVARRVESPLAYKSLKWEFPGGKVEPGETVDEAICREIYEELGCRVEFVRVLSQLEHDYPDFSLNLTVCLCRLSDGSPEPECREHDSLRWVSFPELAGLDWAEADARSLSLVSDDFTQEGC